MSARTGLRHVDPLAPTGPLRRAWAAVVGTRAMGALSKHVGWSVDPYLLRLTRGRVGLGLTLPTAVLETTGARTGQIRRNAVIYFHDGDDVAIVASNLGSASHPAWFHNARANPDVRLGGVPFRAEVVADEEERDRLWALADRVFPAYATYRERASRHGRLIPILRLTPRPATAG